MGAKVTYFIIALLSFIFIIPTVSFAGSKSINIVIKQDPNAEKWLNQVVLPAYKEKYPDRKVNISIIGGSESDYFAKIALLLNTSRNIDVVFEDSAMLTGDVNAEHFAPIPEIKNWTGWKHFFPSLKDAVTFNGKIYGVPWSTDTRGFFYNKNILSKAGIKLPWKPKSWNDIYQALEKIKKNVPNVYPISFSAGATGEATSMQTAEMFLYGTDDSLYKDGKWIVTSKGLLNTLSFIQKLFKNKLTARIDICLSAQYGNMMSQTMAPEQKVAIILDGCWMTGFWKTKFPETFEIYKFTAMPTEFGQPPGHTSMSGGWVMAVSSKSRKKKLALDFIEFALNKQNMLKYVNIVQNLATRKDVAEMKDYPQHLKYATKLLDYTHFRPANEDYPIVSSYLQDAVEAVASQTQTPLQAMDQFANSVERAIGKNKVARMYNENKTERIK